VNGWKGRLVAWQLVGWQFRRFWLPADIADARQRLRWHYRRNTARGAPGRCRPNSAGSPHAGIALAVQSPGKPRRGYIIADRRLEGLERTAGFADERMTNDD